MWSHWYTYYNLRSDATYQQKLPLDAVQAILLATNCLKQNSPNGFSNVDMYPWICVGLHDSTDSDYGTPSTSMLTVTLISVVASKSYEQDIYLKLLREIATNLGWELILDEDDEGNEDVVIQKGGLPA